MYDFFGYANFVALICLVVLFACIYVQPATREKEMLLYIMLAVFISCLGYMFQLSARSKEAATLSLFSAYLGRGLIGFLAFRFFAEYYHLKVPKKLYQILVIVHIFIYFSIVSSNYTGLFYSDIGMGIQKGYRHLILKPGVMWYVYYALMVFYYVFIMWASVSCYRKTKIKQQKRLAFFSMVSVSLPMVGFVLYLNRILYPYNPMELGAVWGVILVVAESLWLHIFDTVVVGKETAIEKMHDMVVILSADCQVTYCNQAVSRLLAQSSAAQQLAGQGIDFASLIVENEKVAKKEIEFDDRTYECEMTRLESGRRLNGYVLNARDVTEQRQYSKHLEAMVRQKTSQLEALQEDMMISFADMIERRDGLTGEHVNRTREYVRMIANALVERGKLEQSEADKMTKVAPLHDIGKIAVPDAILNKPGRLTPEEFEIIKAHTTVGGEMLAEIRDRQDMDGYMQTAYEMALYHHEKWDGSGYPKQISGEQIPLGARIMAIADVFDALVNKRCYKEAFSYEKAFKIISEGAGTHFDAGLVDIFLSMKEQVIAVAESKGRND